jgi:hypothetical protein
MAGGYAGWSWDDPAGALSRYGFWQGRYGGLRADPLFRAGFDLRLASLVSGTLLAFPRQIDIHGALHPVHHVSFFANVGARGRPSGYSDTFDDSHSPYLREAFVMLHEAPYQAYIKGGRVFRLSSFRVSRWTGGSAGWCRRQEAAAPIFFFTSTFGNNPLAGV